MSHPVEEKGAPVIVHNEHDGEHILGRRHSHIEKGPGHIDVHEVDEKELDEAEDAIIAEHEFTFVPHGAKLTPGRRSTSACAPRST